VGIVVGATFYGMWVVWMSAIQRTRRAKHDDLAICGPRSGKRLPRASCSIDPDVGALHDRPPLGDFLLQVAAELGRRHPFGGKALSREPVLDVGHGQHFLQVGVDPVHDRLGRGGWRHHPDEGDRFKVGIALLSHRRYVGQYGRARLAGDGQRLQPAGSDEGRGRDHGVEHVGGLAADSGNCAQVEASEGIAQRAELSQLSVMAFRLRP